MMIVTPTNPDAIATERTSLMGSPSSAHANATTSSGIIKLIAVASGSGMSLIATKNIDIAQAEENAHGKWALYEIILNGAVAAPEWSLRR